MSKEKYYNKIKRFVYRKFEDLEVAERNDGNDLYLHYKNKQYGEILIKKISGEVYYNYEFNDKFFKIINLEKVDFEILLGRWVEDTFQMKVNHTGRLPYIADIRLKIPLK